MMFICLVKFDEVPKAEKSEMKLENERAETKLEQNGTNDKQIILYDAIAICHFLYSSLFCIQVSLYSTFYCISFRASLSAFHCVLVNLATLKVRFDSRLCLRMAGDPLLLQVLQNYEKRRS